MIGASSTLFGIVAYFGFLLFSIDCDYYRIYIESQCGAAIGKIKQIGSQTVVQSGQLTDNFWRKTFQKSAQSRLVWKLFEPQHFQKGSVVLQDFGLVDSPKAHDNSINQGQDQFGRMVVLVSLRKPNVVLQTLLDSKAFAKTLNQPHSTKVGYVSFVEGKINFLRSFWHNAQNTLLVKFLRENLLDFYYTSFPSIIYDFS